MTLLWCFCSTLGIAQLPFQTALDIQRVMNEGQRELAEQQMDSVFAAMAQWQEGEAVANYAIAARIRNRTGRLEEGLTLLKEGELLMDNNTPPSAAVMLYDVYSENCWFRGDPIAAQEVMNTSYDWLQKDTIAVDHARYYNNRAIVSWALGDFATAKASLLEALDRNTAIHGKENKR